MKLSIITINYNNKAGLLRTFKSISIQKSNDFEYIVIDGGSNDGSLEAINEYESIISYWKSEPDKGIYNAMNKGIFHAHGEYCLFLNSGDILSSDVVVSEFNKCLISTDIITGIERFVHYNDEKKVIQSVHYPHEKITTDIFLTSSISHGSSFIRTSLLKKNPYDENLSIVSDWKFFLEQLIIMEASYSPFNIYVNDFDSTGISNTQKKKLISEREFVLNNIAPKRLIRDYISLIEGRSKLEKMIRHERHGGFLEKILTLTGCIILKVSKVINNVRK